MTGAAAINIAIALIVFAAWIAWLLRGRRISRRLVERWVAGAAGYAMTQPDGRGPWYTGPWASSQAQYGDPEFRRRLELGAWLPLAILLPLLTILGALAAAGDWH